MLRRHFLTLAGATLALRAHAQGTQASSLTHGQSVGVLTLDPVAGVDTPDPGTVVLRLSQPFSQLPNSRLSRVRSCRQRPWRNMVRTVLPRTLSGPVLIAWPVSILSLIHISEPTRP